jgi:hypothetical protein
MDVSDADEKVLGHYGTGRPCAPIIRRWPKHVNDGHKLGWKDEAQWAGFLKNFKKDMEHRQVQWKAKRVHMRHGLEYDRIETRCIILASSLAKPCCEDISRACSNSLWCKDQDHQIHIHHAI